MLVLELERRKRNLSLSGFSRLSGVDKGTLSKLEHKKLVPYPGHVKKLAAALNWSKDPAELFQEV